MRPYILRDCWASKSIVAARRFVVCVKRYIFLFFFFWNTFNCSNTRIDFDRIVPCFKRVVGEYGLRYDEYYSLDIFSFTVRRFLFDDAKKIYIYKSKFFSSFLNFVANHRKASLWLVARMHLGNKVSILFFRNVVHPFWRGYSTSLLRFIINSMKLYICKCKRYLNCRTFCKIKKSD